MDGGVKPLGLEAQERMCLAFPPPTCAPGSLQGSWVRSSALRGPLCHVVPRGVGGREEEGGKKEEGERLMGRVHSGTRGSGEA